MLVTPSSFILALDVSDYPPDSETHQGEYTCPSKLAIFYTSKIEKKKKNTLTNEN